MNSSSNFTCSDYLNDTVIISAQTTVAASIVLVLTLLHKRKYMRKYCHGYPGLIYPVNLLEVGKNRFGYAMAFGVSTTAILTLFSNQTFHPSRWVSVLIGIFVVIRATLIYYPLFACLTTDFRLLGSFLGFAYNTQIFTFHVIAVYECPSFKFLGDYSNILFNVPIFICLTWLQCRFGYLLGIEIYARSKRKQSNSEPYPPILLQKFQYKHVKHLFSNRKSNKEPEQIQKPNSVKTFCNRFLYKSIPHFKYPPKIICTFVVTAIALYELTMVYSYITTNIFGSMELWVRRNARGLRLLLNVSDASSLQFVYNGKHAWIVGIILSCCLNTIYLISMFIRYRTNKLKLYRGDKTMLPVDTFTSFGSILRSSICYCGYQISYMIWAFAIIQIIIFLTIMFVIYCIIHPLAGTASTWFLEFVIPIASCALIVSFSQLLVSKYALSLEYGKAYGINNRRLFHNFAYFIFFYNVMCGLFSCLFRIGKAAILGLILLPRMDYSLLMMPFQMFDSGFNSYLGFLYVEHLHCHPVLITFCEILLNKEFDQCVAAMDTPHSATEIEDRYSMQNPKQSNYKIQNKKAFNHWHLAVRLIRNKYLSKLRTQYLEELKEIEELEKKEDSKAAVRKKRLSVNSLLEKANPSNFNTIDSGQKENMNINNPQAMDFAGSAEDKNKANQLDDQNPEQEHLTSAKIEIDHSSIENYRTSPDSSVLIEKHDDKQQQNHGQKADEIPVTIQTSNKDIELDHKTSVLEPSNVSDEISNNNSLDIEISSGEKLQRDEVVYML
ncbi:Stimulated by retinoic acid gene 6 protein-like protein [Trichoplax sp. H2]|nr:Stimulated by retinoic acid gene 6 protein-like protein [Trichoplax sp. H2]|eukprot:RDD47542.1 Stimulated by retinoic acid gene 6 protein-like protein [Trichoplax sp. H2]